MKKVPRIYVKRFLDMGDIFQAEEQLKFSLVVKSMGKCKERKYQCESEEPRNISKCESCYSVLKLGFLSIEGFTGDRVIVFTDPDHNHNLKDTGEVHMLIEEMEFYEKED